MGILNSCEPRHDILTGTFNPEIFTASLSEVLRFYRGDSVGMHPMYTDAIQFFREATYPTEGLKMVVAEVFGRLAGDNSMPAIHRLETAFGGGKTHALIACTHIAWKGKALAEDTRSIIDPTLLPDEGTVQVVGVAGDEIAVHKTQGAALVPYTLWGEIAYQIGGEALYRQVEAEATSYAAPGANYLESVFGGRKILLMLDELAQYAARLGAVQPDGGDQLAGFLMALNGYARRNPGIAILLTLASASDAFANQTERLAGLLSSVRGGEVSKDDALSIGQQSLRGVSSVVARDATAVVPVQAGEISRVLGKRLFMRISAEGASKTAEEYMALYRKNASLLPEQATREEYRDRMAGHYPFHPTLIDFLNNKLSTSEDFQGTRGVLRVLALAVRNIWKKQLDIPMIHACHLDLHDARTVNELINRTGSGDLLPVLNADIGGVDTTGIDGGKSNAQLADQRNRHPAGWPMYEYTWKTVFLHSLAGREEGIATHLFGLTEQDALFAVSFPSLTPSQIGESLKEIENSAFYLRYNQGRYFASLDPSINIALARIRRTLGSEELDQALDVTARKVVSPDIQTFTVVHDVAAPEHIPDKKGKPILAMVSLNAGVINVQDCITTAGPNTPRLEQNLVFLLVPDTVSTQLQNDQAPMLFGESTAIDQHRNQLRELARTVLAMRKLSQNPNAYGIKPKKLEEDNFRQRFSEREKALETSVTLSYKSLWFPSATGQITKKEIRTAGGEGGASVFEQIRKVLLDDGELVTADHTTQSHLRNLAKLFFGQQDTVTLEKLRQNFCRIRTWPILDAPAVFDQLIRAGVSRGAWSLFRMGSDENTKPDELYSQEAGEVPFNADLRKDYSLVTPDGARKRGWSGDGGPDLTKVKEWVRKELSDKQAETVGAMVEAITEKHGNVPKTAIVEMLTDMVKSQKAMTFKGAPDQAEKPGEVLTGTSAVFYVPDDDDVIITPAKVAERGWITAPERAFQLRGKDGASQFLPLLRRLGSIYNRGATSTLDSLDITDLELPHGGRLRLSLHDAGPESMKDTAELFEVLANLTRAGRDTEVYLDIAEPEENCALLKEITSVNQKR
ncbi:MAG: ATP-binding protein [Thermodesulfobacteriota bacterium]